jgi:hypothetical protein
MVSSGYECPAAGTAMHEAAAEIERLRASLADIADPPEHYTINDCRCVAAAALAPEKPND